MKNMMKKCALLLLALTAGVCGGLQAREITVVNEGPMVLKIFVPGKVFGSYWRKKLGQIEGKKRRENANKAKIEISDKTKEIAVEFWYYDGERLTYADEDIPGYKPPTFGFPTVDKNDKKINRLSIKYKYHLGKPAF